MEKVRRASKSVVDAGAKQMLKVRALCNKQASSRNRNRNRNRNFNRVTSEYERDSKRKKNRKQKNTTLLSPYNIIDRSVVFLLLSRVE
jgi:hypothetical protein